MKRIAGVGVSGIVVASLLALCATNAGASTQALVTKALNIGTGSATGAVIEAEYTVSSDVAQTARARQNAVRRGVQGRYDFNEAMTYLKRSPRAANVIARIESANSQLIVVVNDTCNDNQHMGASWRSIIAWDPHCAYRIANGSNSPAMVLLHELVHTLHLFEDPETYLNALCHKNARFSDDEERRTILYGEIPVERELGELVRTGHHDGAPFIVYDPTAR